jgi:hypothetical protein
VSKPNTELIHLPYPIYRQCGSVTCPSDKNLKFSVTHYKELMAQRGLEAMQAYIDQGEKDE